MIMIELKNVTKTFKIGKDQEFVALNSINLSVEEGEFMAIMGPSGSGKSTLMNIIGMLDNQTSGEYFLRGQKINDLKDWQKTRIRGENIGFVFQNYSLIPRMKVLKQVMIPLIYAGVGRIKAKERAIEALRKVGLETKLNSKPDELSGGQKQRVAIARAIVINPAIILADEPTGALDTKTGNEVMEIFRELNREGKTIVVITHEQDIGKQTNRIVNVKDGILI